jgi:hypothetical protein
MPSEMAGRSHHPSHAERRTDFFRMSRVVRAGPNHFLQRDDVGVQRRQDLDRAVRQNPPVHPTAAMNVVGDDAEASTVQVKQVRWVRRVRYVRCKLASPKRPSREGGH